MSEEKPGADKTMRSQEGRERDFRDIARAWPYDCSDKVNRIIMALTDEVVLLMKERDAAIGKYHAEIHDGRIRCEGIVSIAEDAAFRLGKAEGLENAVSILNGCEEAGRTARLEIEHRLREMKSWSPE